MQILSRPVLINRFIASLPEADAAICRRGYEVTGRLPTDFSEAYQEFAWCELKRELAAGQQDAGQLSQLFGGNTHA